MSHNVIFALPDPGYESYTWMLQDEHNPASHTPLIASGSPLVGTGDEQNSLQPPPSLNINGYTYARRGANRAGASSPFGTIVPPERLAYRQQWRPECIPDEEQLAAMAEAFRVARGQGGTAVSTNPPPRRARNGASLSDPRVVIHNQDAMKFLEQSDSIYDVILMDLPDPSDVGLSKLYSSAFYRLAARRLAANGMMASQCTSPFRSREAFWCIVNTIEASDEGRG